VVVDLVQDLDLGPIAEGPVGDVELPAFVGLIGLEADVGALGALVGLGGDEPAPGQDPPDRRDRRRLGHAALQVEPDGLGAVVMAQLVELFAYGHDLVLEGLRDPLRAPVRSTGSGLQPGFAFGHKALHQDLNPPARNPIVAGDLALGAALPNDRCDHQPRH